MVGFRLPNLASALVLLCGAFAFTMALFNPMVQWHGLKPDEDGCIRLSTAEFSISL